MTYYDDFKPMMEHIAFYDQWKMLSEAVPAHAPLWGMMDWKCPGMCMCEWDG